MAVLFFDGFDHYTTGQFTRKWSASRNGSPQMTTGRFGTGWSGSERWSRIDFVSNYGTMIVGCAAQMSAMSVNDAIFSFQDAASFQVEIRYNPTTDTLYITRNGTTIGGSYSFIPNTNQWYYIEAKVTFHNSTGAVVVNVDGVERINSTALDTQNTGNAYANQIRIGSVGDNFGLPNIDDIYIADTSGSAPQNDFLGDCRVENIVPNGNGNSSQLMGSDGNTTDNYLLTDENPNANDDTDYVESGTVGQKDTYNYSSIITTAGTIYAIQTLPTMRKTDAGARSAKTIARLSGTEEDGAEQILGTSYALTREVRQTKPGGGAWTVPDINAAEFGVKVFS
jgi:hypothetical protein